MQNDYTLLYSHARQKGKGKATGVCTRERKRKYRKGEEDAQRKPERESKEKEKRTEEKGIERLKRKKAGRRGNRSKGGKYEKKGRDRSLLKFYTLGKRKNYAIRNNWINILRGTFQSTPTYVSARLSMKIKNYNLLSSVTVSGVID